MTRKLPICPDRIRSIPEQFSWVDHRLIRDRHIERLSHQAAALYLFLVTVADCQGLSYYSDPSLCERLAMDAPMLDGARLVLRQAGLVAYKKPLYQVLPIGDVLAPKRNGAPGEHMAIGETFKKLAGGSR
jgi:hypothetical protein